jgi:putative glutamine amidotransferase
MRDVVEMKLMDAAVKQKKKIFGICRGQQLINVYFGGTLYQNIQAQAKTKVRHMQDQVDQLAHKVTIVKDSFLGKIYSKSNIWTNSYHNQAVKDFGKDLIISAKSSSDGIIEAIEHISLPIYAVQ